MAKRNAPVYTDVVQLYNNNLSACKFGYVNFAGFIKISPVLDEQRGKKARRGTSMYDYDSGIIISFNAAELAEMLGSFDQLASGKKAGISFSHKSGNSVKNFVIGKNIDEQDGNNFQIYLAEFDRDDPDGEPIADVWFEVNLDEEGADAALILIKNWIKSALDVTMKTASHLVRCSGGFQSGEGNRRSYRQNNEDNDDSPNQERRRRPNSGGRSSKPNQNDEEGTPFNPDDEIPF
jgi:hypothetical protein